MNAVREVVEKLLRLLVEGEWKTLAMLTSESRLSIHDVRSAIEAYGRTLTMPPREALDCLDVVKVAGAASPTLSVRVPLWSVEEGRGDLELALTLVEVADGLWRAHIDDVLVP